MKHTLGVIFLFQIGFILFGIERNESVLHRLAVRLPLNCSPPELGASLWPKPVHQDSDLTYAFINKNLFKIGIDSNLNVCERDIIEKLWKHYENILFPPKLAYDLPDPFDKQINLLKFTLKQKSPEEIVQNCASKYYPLIEDTETEAYAIDVNQNEIKLEASTVWGLIRALESFTQLTYYFPGSNKITINMTRVNDRPRFAHRGIMIDTARHYMPIPLLKKHMDSMLYNKMNVFHWHIVDDQSFPFVSETYPELSRKGAFTDKHIYTKQDIKELIEFARIRGIRVIPELDTPGHTFSWGFSYPELITPCWTNGEPFRAVYGQYGEREVLYPLSEYTYEFVGNVIKEFKDTFRDPYIHLGMDEVYYRCWESNPNITEWMRVNNYNSTRYVEQYYMGRVLQNTKNIGYKSIVWEDVLNNGVEVFKDTIIQLWKTQNPTTPNEKLWTEYMNQATQKGYNVLLSSPWYLNIIKYGNDWYEFYNVEPYNFEGTDEQKKLILGGEACMWSEYIDGANSLSRLWPRASAVAERLWSLAEVNDVEEAKYRLDDHRCRLLRRGFEAAPIFNSHCGDYEPFMENSLLNEPVFNYHIKENSNSATRGLSLSKISIFSLISISFMYFIIL